MTTRRRLRIVAALPVLLAGPSWAGCREPADLVQPDRPPLHGSLPDGTAGRTVAQLFATLGPAHAGGPTADGGGRRRLEWWFADQRGLVVEFDRFCARPSALRREGMSSPRRAEIRARAGLWMVSRAEVDAVNERARTLGQAGNYAGPDPFYLDGATVTVVLVPFFSVDAMRPGRPLDNTYRLATRWVGEDLHFLTPREPHWILLAGFRDGHFEVSLDESGRAESPPGPPGTVTWRYERVPVEQAPISARGLASLRGLWNYRLGAESLSDPD